jgi:hypothetical protein
VETIIEEYKPPTEIKRLLDKILKYIWEMEQNQSKENSLTAEVSALCSAIKTDLHRYYLSLKDNQEVMYDASMEILAKAKKGHKTAEETKKVTTSLEDKVGNVSEVANKIESYAKSYQDAVLTKVTVPNRANADPKVLGDMERRAKQILIQIHNEKGTDTLAKSLTELKDKANKVIAMMTNRENLENIKVETVLKAQERALMLTFNSKKAVTWLKDTLNEHMFTESLPKVLPSGIGTIT